MTKRTMISEFRGGWPKSLPKRTERNYYTGEKLLTKGNEDFTRNEFLDFTRCVDKCKQTTFLNSRQMRNKIVPIEKCKNSQKSTKI